MRKLGTIVFVLAATVLLAASLAVPAAADLSPNSVSLTLDPGECAKVTKSVTIESLPPMADVVFAFDLTGTMWPILQTAQNDAQLIMTTLNTDGIDIQFGVISYMDYPAHYESCGYVNTDDYGDPGDYPYRLDQSVTANEAAVTASINALSIGSGRDFPESYGRVLYESWADLNVGWRAGAKRILVNFGDDLPHDCNVNEGIYDSVLSTGVDPGHDGELGTGDEIDFQDDALAGMILNNVILLACQTDGAYSDYWGPWATSTGGNVYDTSAGDLPAQVVAAVTEGLTSTKVKGLHLAVVDKDNTDGTWASFNPDPYPSDITPPDTVQFTETICVPPGTPEGSYHFTVAAVDDAGVYYGKQDVTIRVGEGPHPSIPGLTQWGTLVMTVLIATVALLMLRRKSARVTR